MRGRGRSGGRVSGRGNPSVHFVETSNESINNEELEDFQYGEACMMYSSIACNVHDPIPQRHGYIAWV